MTNDLKPLCTVATASVILTDKDDPYRILVADSAKHPFPVIPGGKVELMDMLDHLVIFESGQKEAFFKKIRPFANDPSNVHQAAIRCISREIHEEVGVQVSDGMFIGIATDASRDIRKVPFKKIKETITNPALPDGIADEELVVAAYGCPDYIFSGVVSLKDIEDTEELKGHRFIDIRTLKTGELSVGHDVIVLWYRDMLDKGAAQMDPTAMQNFEEERKLLSGPARSNQTDNAVKEVKKFTR